VPEFSVLVVEDSPQRVFLTGDLNVATAPRITEVLCGLPGDVTVDCTGITLIDTAGFAALDWSFRVATLRGNAFTITGLRRLQPREAELTAVPSLPAGQAEPRQGR
jgi:ABC-type transporter Mla MlaB component